MPSNPATVPLPVPAAAPAKPGLLLTQNKSWEYVGIPRSTWFRLRSAGSLPEPVNVPGSGLFWRRADLDKWVASLKPERRSRRRSGHRQEASK